MRVSADMGAGKPPFWKVLKAHLRADPKKTGILSVLALVMVGMYGRMFLSGPSQSAEAQPVEPDVSVSPPVAAATEPDPARPPVERIEVVGVMADELVRDPFTSGADPWSRASSDSANRSMGDASFVLELTSTLCCDDPVAGISGRFLRPGDRIQGYVLERVEPTRVWLRKDGQTVELSLR